MIGQDTAAVEAEIANALAPSRKSALDFHLDSGAMSTVIPAATLEALGIAPTGQRTFILANGQPVQRRIGEARITFEGRSATCVVLFGEAGDNTLLGVTTLENLGLIFDPLHQKILPLPMLLAEVRRMFGPP